MTRGSDGYLGGVLGIVTEGLLSAEAYGGAVADVEPATAHDQGGEILTLYGEFPLATELLVSVRAGSVSYPCFSGIPGQGYVVTSPEGATLAVVTPPLPVGGPYAFRVQRQDDASYVDSTTYLTVVRRPLLSAEYDLRRHFPTRWATGPRRPEDED